MYVFFCTTENTGKITLLRYTLFFYDIPQVFFKWPLLLKYDNIHYERKYRFCKISIFKSVLLDQLLKYKNIKTVVGPNIQ